MPDGKLKQAVKAYFTDLRLIRSFGGATDERSLDTECGAVFGHAAGNARQSSGSPAR